MVKLKLLLSEITKPQFLQKVSCLSGSINKTLLLHSGQLPNTYLNQIITNSYKPNLKLQYPKPISLHKHYITITYTEITVLYILYKIKIKLYTTVKPPFTKLGNLQALTISQHFLQYHTVTGCKHKK